MKNLLITLLIFCVGITSGFTPLPGSSEIVLPSPFEDIVTALKKGDAGSLTAYLDSNVEINISGKSDTYSKAQAIVILKDFFNKNSVKSFDLIHQGEGGGGSRFGIGNLVTTNGSYRTSFFLQKKGTALILNELRFENKQ